MNPVTRALYTSGVSRSQHGNLAPLIDNPKIEPWGFHALPDGNAVAPWELLMAGNA